MAVRGSIESRFDAGKKFFAQVQAGYMDITMAKANFVDVLGYCIYESELDKFAAKNPDVDLEAFKQFLISIDALKTAKKAKATTSGGSKTHLNTIEAAEERGVAAENIEQYLALVNTVYSTCKELKALVKGKAAVSFSMATIKEKPVEAAVEAAVEATV